MEGFAFADIIFFALLAAYILNRLRTTLGQDDGNRLPTGNPFTASKTKEEKDNVVQHPAAKEPVIIDVAEESSYPEPEITDKALLKKIDGIKKKDSNFNLGHFIFGANAAFEMVLDAFAKGDKESLQNLLSKEIYSEFEAEIDKRAKAKKIEETTLVAVLKNEIIDASLKGSVAEIVIDFVTEQMTFVKDAKGKVIEGDSSVIEEVDDKVRFRRDLKSSDPNWTIISFDS